MTSRTLSSSVKIRTSELPHEVWRRSGIYGDNVKLDYPLVGLTRRQDQRHKDNVTSALYRLDLDNVLAPNDFRRGYLHALSPSDALLLQTDHLRPSRRHSYIDPSFVRHHARHAFKGKDLGPVRVKEVRFKEPEDHISPSTLWYYTEPRSHTVHRSTASPYTGLGSDLENRALTEYRDTLATPVATRHQRWSVYGSTPWHYESRSRSTPPDFHRESQVRVPVGNIISRRKNHEFSIGQKLAESHTDLDTFDRLLDKKFGSGNWRNTRSFLYPSWAYTNYTSPLYYDYKTSVPYNNFDYVPYSGSSSRYTRYVPTGYVPSRYLSSRYVPTTYSYVDYGPSTFRNEPWYTPYSRRSYYAGYPDWSLSRGVTSYLL